VRGKAPVARRYVKQAKWAPKRPVERRLGQEGSACDLGQAAAKGNARGHLDFPPLTRMCSYSSYSWWHFLDYTCVPTAATMWLSPVGERVTSTILATAGFCGWCQEVWNHQPCMWRGSKQGRERVCGFGLCCYLALRTSGRPDKYIAMLMLAS